MSALRLLVIVALVLTFVPMPTAQAYSCSGLTQTRTLAGNTVTASIQNCQDSYSYGTFTQQYLSNETRVTIDTTQNYRVVLDAYNWWYHAADPSYSYDATQRGHSYQLYFQDMTYTRPVGGGVVGASDNQWTSSSYGCSESLNAGTQVYSSEAYQYQQEVVNMGNSRVLPCTSDDVQQALP